MKWTEIQNCTQNVHQLMSCPLKVGTFNLSSLTALLAVDAGGVIAGTECDTINFLSLRPQSKMFFSCSKGRSWLSFRSIERMSSDTHPKSYLMSWSCSSFWRRRQGSPGVGGESIVSMMVATPFSNWASFHVVSLRRLPSVVRDKEG